MKSKNLIVAVLGVVCAGLAAFAVYTAMAKPGEGKSQPVSGTSQDERYITYKGKEYKKNPDIRTVLLMGIDKESGAAVGDVTGDAGQADSLNLLILNTEKETAKILQISRDSMVNLEVYDTSGEKVMMTDGQICLQYAYGDGGKKSCRLTSERVSELLAGVDINDYLALTLDGISAAVDAVGGVAITVPEDYTWIDPSFQKGTTITLNGEQAEKYVRSRDTEALDSNQQRMERQSQFMKALLIQLGEGGFRQTDAASMYQEMKPYMTTNMSVERLEDFSQYDFEEEMLTLPGHVVEKDGHAQYLTDAEQVKELVIQEFYVER